MKLKYEKITEYNLIGIKENFSQKVRTANTGLAKVAVQCSADTFVVNQTFVLHINICGKIRHLSQARNRDLKSMRIEITQRHADVLMGDRRKSGGLPRAPFRWSLQNGPCCCAEGCITMIERLKSELREPRSCGMIR